MEKLTPFECSMSYVNHILNLHEMGQKGTPCLVYAKYRGGDYGYVAVDNSSGKAFTRDFPTAEEAIAWLEENSQKY